jgi:hypothetical protein
MIDTHPGQALAGLDRLLSGGLRSLDITPAEHDRVTSRYTELSGEFDLHWSATRGHNVISPQGSFLLGTVVRNIHRNDDIDIDCVALRDVDKASTTQADLKADVGAVVQRFAAKAHSGHPGVSQCTRCWTLTWSGMHLDVLPAIPNRDEGGTNILITDREVRSWLPSNPAGYAEWFRSRMREEFLARREVLAKQLEVEEVPDWRVKTTLQQAVQALKRHRDVYFTDRLDDRPPSIIITTAAAMAYTGRGELYDVLREITARMGDHLNLEEGQWVLANPSQEGENFADSWAGDPSRTANFFEWLEDARSTFDGLGQRGGLERTVPRLAEAFGDRFAKAAAETMGTSMHQARLDGRLQVVAGGALLAATSGRAVRNHGFAGGSTR